MGETGRFRLIAKTPTNYWSFLGMTPPNIPTVFSSCVFSHHKKAGQLNNAFQSTVLWLNPQQYPWAGWNEGDPE